MTYSIVARDAVSGELGVAVQSHWFSVGSVVTWAESGVGVIATQAFAEVSYGPLGLVLLKAGHAPSRTLTALTSVDEAADRRQVAIVDATGAVAAHTGTLCIPEAGHRTGPGWSVQANMMLRDTVPGAMAAAFEGASGDLADRMLAALDAAEAEGGDIRGRQSAAVLVVAGSASGRPWADRLVDLRVDDHPEPLVELRRLLSLHRAYRLMTSGDDELARGDVSGAGRRYQEAQRAVRDNPEFTFWQAVTLAGSGSPGRARELLSTLPAGSRDRWLELLQRLPSAGLLAQEALAELEVIPPGT